MGELRFCVRGDASDLVRAAAEVVRGEYGDAVTKRCMVAMEVTDRRSEKFGADVTATWED